VSDLAERSSTATGPTTSVEGAADGSSRPDENPERDPRLGLLVAGRFRLERRIGGGAMGDVYLASHEGLGRQVAVKVLRASARRGSRARFRREATIAARLTGVHVVRVTDFGELPDSSPFLVMDYVDGPTLAHELARRKRLPVDEAIGRALEICEALAEAHRAGIVHRDIKPANLLLARAPDGSRVLRVADFGVAKAEGESTLTGDGASLGSPSYMAPEQIVDAHSVDARADLWAVGVVLYELLAGQRPFDGTSVAGTLLSVSHQQPVRLDALSPSAGISPDVADVVARCLAKNPDDRFANAAALADALAALGGAEARTVAARIRRVGAPADGAGDHGVGTPHEHRRALTQETAKSSDHFDARTADPHGGTDTEAESESLRPDANASTVTGGVTTPNLAPERAAAPPTLGSRRKVVAWAAPTLALGALLTVVLLRGQPSPDRQAPSPTATGPATALPREGDRARDREADLPLTPVDEPPAVPITSASAGAPRAVPGRDDPRPPPAAAEPGTAAAKAKRSPAADAPTARPSTPSSTATPTSGESGATGQLPAPSNPSARPPRPMAGTELDDLGPRK
jgi:eukaryotic-like serine/threonine-protein kinase